MHQRIGAGDHRLAGDHGRRRRQHDHRQQEGVGHQPVERILDRRRIGQHLGALPEIIDQQRRQHERQPGRLDRLAAEMAEIGIERLAAGDHEEHGAERDQADFAVIVEERDAVERIDREQHMRIVADMQRAGDRDGDEPDHHDRPEQRRDLGGAAALRREQPDQDDDRERRHHLGERGARELQPFHRREHRNCRRDHRIAEKHRGADHADDEDKCGAAAERARRQRRERQRAALPVIVGAQQDQHVFHRHGDDQRPDDERQHAEHDGCGRRRGRGSRRSPPRERRKAGWCRYRHRRRRRCRARAQPELGGATVPVAIGGMGRGRACRLVHAITHARLFVPPGCAKSGPYNIATRMENTALIARDVDRNQAMRRNLAVSGLEIGRKRRLFPHQGDGDAAIGRHRGIVGEQRLGVGLAGDHIEIPAGQALAIRIWRTALARSAESSHGP